jgi:spore germination protein KC
MDADIYGFGESLNQKYPKQWDKMKKQWDEIYINIELDVQVKTRIPELGETAQSLEMEGVGS